MYLVLCISNVLLSGHLLLHIHCLYLQYVILSIQYLILTVYNTKHFIPHIYNILYHNITGLDHHNIWPQFPNVLVYRIFPVYSVFAVCCTLYSMLYVFSVLFIFYSQCTALAVWLTITYSNSSLSAAPSLSSTSMWPTLKHLSPKFPTLHVSFEKKIIHSSPVFCKGGLIGHSGLLSGDAAFHIISV